jgi:transposase
MGSPVLIFPKYNHESFDELLAAVRRHPWGLGLPFTLWMLQRLVDILAERTGTRVSDGTIRHALKQWGMVLSCPSRGSAGRTRNIR